MFVKSQYFSVLGTILHKLHTADCGHIRPPTQQHPQYSTVSIARRKGIDIIINEVSKRETSSMVSFGTEQEGRMIGEKVLTPLTHPTTLPTIFDQATNELLGLLSCSPIISLLHLISPHRELT